jgi:hypothetical protein
MVEIFFSFLSIFVFLLIFSYPINIFNYNIFFKAAKFNIFDTILLNVVFHLNILLFLSFFSLDLNKIFIAHILVGILFFIFYYKNYSIFIKKELFLVIFFLINCYCLFIAIVSNPTLGWDGVAHWFFKVQTYFQDGNFKNLKNLPYDYYPHLGTYVWAYFWKNSFLQFEYYGRFFFIFVFLTTIFSLGSQLNTKFSNIEKMIFIFITMYLCTDFFLFSGYQEYLIFTFFYIFSRLFLAFQNTKTKNHVFIIYILLTSFLFLWIKQEGFFYFIILNFIFITLYDDNKINKLIYILGCLLLFCFFVFIKINFFDGLKFNEALLHRELSHNLNIFFLLDKIIIITKYIFISFIKYPVWIFIIFSILILLSKNNYLKEKKFIYLSFSLFLILIYAIYLQTSMDIKHLLPLTLSRISFQMSGLFLFVIVDLVNNLKRI